jgi:hypothetical protein
MPFLSWTPHTGCCPVSALRGHHEHHHTFNNPSRRPSSGWRRLLRTETPVGKKEIAAILKLSADEECLIAQEVMSVVGTKRTYIPMLSMFATKRKADWFSFQLCRI